MHWRREMSSFERHPVPGTVGGREDQTERERAADPPVYMSAERGVLRLLSVDFPSLFSHSLSSTALVLLLTSRTPNPQQHSSTPLNFRNGSTATTPAWRRPLPNDLSPLVARHYGHSLGHSSHRCPTRRLKPLSRCHFWWRLGQHFCKHRPCRACRRRARSAQPVARSEPFRGEPECPAECPLFPHS